MNANTIRLGLATLGAFLLSLAHVPARVQLSTGSDIQTDISDQVVIDRSTIPSPWEGASSDLIESSDGLARVAAREGAFRVGVSFSHMNFDDPILYPCPTDDCPPDLSHLHAYFGHGTANRTLHWDALQGQLLPPSGSTSDGGTANRSAYWVPALVDALNPGAARVIQPDWALIYKTGRIPVGAAQRKTQPFEPVPPGIRLIAGDADHDSTPQDLAYWDCFETSVGHVSSPPVDACRTAVQQQGLDVRSSHVAAEVLFPQCWDGQSLWRPNNAHVVFPVDDQCPPDHPHPFAQVTIIVAYRLDAFADNFSASRYRLSSDHYSRTLPDGTPSPGGGSIHADYFYGWRSDLVSTWTTKCLNPIPGDRPDPGSPDEPHYAWDCHTSFLGDKCGVPNGCRLTELARPPNP